MRQSSGTSLHRPLDLWTWETVRPRKRESRSDLWIWETALPRKGKGRSGSRRCSLCSARDGVSTCCTAPGGSPCEREPPRSDDLKSVSVKSAREALHEPLLRLRQSWVSVKERVLSI